VGRGRDRSGGDPGRLGELTVLLIGLYLLAGALAWAGGFLLGVGLRVVADLRLALYEHFQTLPLGFFTERRTGELWRSSARAAPASRRS